MYGLHNEFAFLVVTKKDNFIAQIRFLFGLQILLKKVNCSLLVRPFFWDSVRRPEKNSHSKWAQKLNFIVSFISQSRQSPNWDFMSNVAKPSPPNWCSETKAFYYFSRCIWTKPCGCWIQTI
jgi:hypothetical protein